MLAPVSIHVNFRDRDRTLGQQTGQEGVLSPKLGSDKTQLLAGFRRLCMRLLEIYHHDLGSRDNAGAERGLLRTERDNYCRELPDHDFTGSQPIYNCKDNTVNPHHELKIATPLVGGYKRPRNYPR